MRRGLHLGRCARDVRRRGRRNLAVEADPRDHSVRRRQRDRRHAAHRVRAAVARSSASRSWSRTAAARAARSASARSRRPIRTATRSWCNPPRTRSRRRSIRICPMTPAAISSRVGAIGSVPNVLIIAPSKGFKTIQDFVACREGEARHVQLRLGRRRLGGASERRALPHQRRLRGRAHPVQGRRRSADRGDRRPRRLLLLPDRDRAAAYPRRQAARRSRCRARSARRRCRTCRRRSSRGYPDSDYTFWIGVFAPAKTPQEIVDEAQPRTAQGAGRRRPCSEKLATLGVEPMPMTPPSSTRM